MLVVRYPQDFFKQHKRWHEFKAKSTQLRRITGDPYEQLPKTSLMMKDQTMRNFLWFVNFELSYHLAWRKQK